MAGFSAANAQSRVNNIGPQLEERLEKGRNILGHGTSGDFGQGITYPTFGVFDSTQQTNETQIFSLVLFKA